MTIAHPPPKLLTSSRHLFLGRHLFYLRLIQACTVHMKKNDVGRVIFESRIEDARSARPTSTCPSRAHGSPRDASDCGSTACPPSASHPDTTPILLPSICPTITRARTQAAARHTPPLAILTSHRLRSLSPAGASPNGNWRTHTARRTTAQSQVSVAQGSWWS